MKLSHLVKFSTFIFVFALSSAQAEPGVFISPISFVNLTNDTLTLQTINQDLCLTETTGLFISNDSGKGEYTVTLEPNSISDQTNTKKGIQINAASAKTSNTFGAMCADNSHNNLISIQSANKAIKPMTFNLAFPKFASKNNPHLLTFDGTNLSFDKTKQYDPKNPSAYLIQIHNAIGGLSGTAQEASVIYIYNNPAYNPTN